MSCQSPRLSTRSRTLLCCTLLLLCQTLHAQNTLTLDTDGVPVLLAAYLAPQRELFPATTEDTSVGGVHAIVYTPSVGIAAENQDKVLINLHGGGFSGCWLGCAELESRPIAELGRIKVVSLDYRKSPDPNDPLVAPANHPAVLAQFPPTLILSGTRSYDLSNAVHTHLALAKQHVPAELYVWEGMFHGFFYNPDVPESQECLDFIVRFFNQWLGRD